MGKIRTIYKIIERYDIVGNGRELKVRKLSKLGEGSQCISVRTAKDSKRPLDAEQPGHWQLSPAEDWCWQSHHKQEGITFGAALTDLFTWELIFMITSVYEHFHNQMLNGSVHTDTSGRAKCIGYSAYGSSIFNSLFPAKSAATIVLLGKSINYILSVD